jgi:MYXO-CTERM domain-containing protein
MRGPFLWIVLGLLGLLGEAAFAATPTVTIVLTPSAPIFGDHLSFQVTVSGGGGGPVPTGTVDIDSGDGTWTFPGLALDGSGVATGAQPNQCFGTTNPGSYTATATYSGDGNYSSATGTLGYSVAKVTPVGIVLELAANPVTVGTTVTLNGGLELGDPACSCPTQGTFKFFDGTTQIGSGQFSDSLCPQNFAEAMLDVSTFTVGTHPLTVSYTGDPTIDDVISPEVDLVVNAAPDAGVPDAATSGTPDAASGGAPDAAAGGTPDAGSTPPKKSGGCGCAVGGGAPSPVAVLLFGVLIVSRRRIRGSSAR